LTSLLLQLAVAHYKKSVTGFFPGDFLKAISICIPTKHGQWKGFTMEFSRWRIFKLTDVVGFVGIGSLALIHFIPTPPSKVVMAAGFKGASFEYYGRQYQEILARSHVQLELPGR
jgi:hypothetical protein